MDNPNETPEVEEDEIEEIKDEPTDWEAKAKEMEGRNKRLQTKLDKKADKPDETNKSKKTDGLDDSTLDFLDLKGFEEQDDIDFIAAQMKIQSITGLKKARCHQ